MLGIVRWTFATNLLCNGWALIVGVVNVVVKLVTLVVLRALECMLCLRFLLRTNGPMLRP